MGLYVLGLDGGGTKTLAQAMNAEGTPLFRVGGGALNLNSETPDRVRAVVRAARCPRRETAGCPESAPCSAGRSGRSGSRRRCHPRRGPPFDLFRFLERLKELLRGGRGKQLFGGLRIAQDTAKLLCLRAGGIAAGDVLQIAALGGGAQLFRRGLQPVGGKLQKRLQLVFVQSYSPLLLRFSLQDMQGVRKR